MHKWGIHVFLSCFPFLKCKSLINLCLFSMKWMFVMIIVIFYSAKFDVPLFSFPAFTFIERRSLLILILLLWQPFMDEKTFFFLCSLTCEENWWASSFSLFVKLCHISLFLFLFHPISSRDTNWNLLQHNRKEKEVFIFVGKSTYGYKLKWNFKPFLCIIIIFLLSPFTLFLFLSLFKFKQYRNHIRKAERIYWN